MPYYNNTIWGPYNPPPRTSDEEWESAFKEFLDKGGQVQIMRDDGGAYDKNLKKIQKNLNGGFNPFSKNEALTVNKDSIPKKNS